MDAEMHPFFILSLSFLYLPRMKYFFFTALVILSSSILAQTNKIDIARVEQMPGKPSPYLMRDWKDVARKYDALVFNQNLTGTYLPLITLKPAGNNYPSLKPIQLDTYVGTNSESQAEAINIIPSIVSASLVDVDKSSQNGINWVEKIKDFYNSANGQNVYLNGTNSFSGNDWWYDVMPNVFFYQVYDLYPDIPDFDNQFNTVADQWLSAVHNMGGKTTPWAVPSMNYRAWNLATMTGNPNGVKEPEAAGAIAWLLYQAYHERDDKKYLYGAQMCLEFLSALSSNPSYELQLPYGTLTAAKLNAELGTNYDINKMLNWSFDRGPLRGWGAIVGTWDGKDISGVIGEANDAGNDYAFLMNGFQQAGALIPLAKYDKRFARALAKWMLNLANASRLFYPQYLAADKQDDYAWSNEFDPGSAIAYEALKENIDGKALYGTGDAKRSGWAETNLGLYGSSHVGYLAAIVEPTNVEMILKLDLNKTDFFADNTYPSYLFFNPHETAQQVTLNPGVGVFDLYDAISESTVGEDISDDFSFTIKADEVVLLTILPAGTIVEPRGGKLYAGSHVIDHAYGYDFSPKFRIKAFESDKNEVEFNETLTLFATVEDAPAAVSYKWFQNDVPINETSVGDISWTAPATEGLIELKVQVVSGSSILKDSLTVSVLQIVPTAPVITALSKDKTFYTKGEVAKIIAPVESSDRKNFTYEWDVPSGSFTQQDSMILWTTADEGLYSVKCTVKNEFDLSASAAIDVLVKSESAEMLEPLAYYPLNNDVEDYSGNNFHAQLEGTQQADDALGMNDFAHRFSSGNDLIFVANRSELNFREAVTLAFWMSPGTVGHEAFLLSHGSWEERWKISITPDKKLRWTVKTDNAVVDLDSSLPVATNKFTHVTVVYTGYSMEMYLDGVLDQYAAHSGSIMTTGKSVTFGEKDYSDRQYYYNGVLDEIRIYDNVLQPDQISLLQTLWQDEPTAVMPEWESIQVYPNPSYSKTFIIDHAGQNLSGIQLTGIDGKAYAIEAYTDKQITTVKVGPELKGMYFLKIDSSEGTKYVKVILK
jgi:hypothetical protein